MAGLFDLIVESKPEFFMPLDDADNPLKELGELGLTGISKRNNISRGEDLFYGGVIYKSLRAYSRGEIIIPSFEAAKQNTFTVEFLIQQYEAGNLVVFERSNGNNNFTFQTLSQSHLDALGGDNDCGIMCHVGSIQTENQYPLKNMNETYHCIFTVDAGVKKTYVNGNLVQTVSVEKQSSTSDLQLSLFSRSGNFQTTASLGMLAFYGRVLNPTEIESRASLFFGELDISYNAIELTKSTFSNKETKEQANNYPSKVNFIIKKNEVEAISRLNGYNSFLDGKGVAREVGYYESKVLISGEAVPNKKVLCFTNSGHLVAETISNSEGEYRFDYLDLKRKYMFVAQYSNEVDTPPDYAAVAADWQSPIPYKE